MSTIPELTKHAREAMHKAIESTKRELSTIRSGKASTALLDLVRVEAYGSPVPLNQVGLVSAPEPRLLTVQPFDKSLAPAIEKAIRDSDLGLNPATSGDMIRVPMPPLTEERRKELIKVVHKEAEAAKIAVRNVRRDANEQLKKLAKDKQCSEDDERRAHEELQKLTDHFVAEVDRLLQAKEADLMAI
jgi:ribosome recycling factor